MVASEAVVVVVPALRAANVKVESKVVVFVLLAAVECKVVLWATVGKLAAVVILERVLVQVLLLLLLVLL